MIKVKNLTKKYNDFIAVNNINFNINKGEIVGFVGKNGAGKTTTIRCIMNMLFFSFGEIKIEGLNSVTDTKEIKNILSYMPGESLFYESIKVIDLLKLVLKFSKKNEKEIYELSNYFELDINKKINELSLGNKKKLSIIVALLKNHKILILDEPTNGLDPLMQKKFFKLILKEREKGVTIFLSSHNLNEVENYCDRVIIIKNGKIVKEVDMLKARKSLKQMITYTLKDGTKKKYEFAGNINKELKKLTNLDLSLLEIKTKSITEEFINFYESGEKDE